jgi:DNA-binding Lrp family transcriptional regulator
MLEINLEAYAVDAVDRQLLNIIQTNFPIASRPYRVLAEKLGVTETDVLERVQRLFETGVIRRIGPSFESRSLGYTSTLVAAKVPEEQLKEVVSIVNSFHQVTHNYSRDSEYNLWFTLICKNENEVQQVLEEIKSRTGISEVYTVPAKRVFKLKVEFEF